VLAVLALGGGATAAAAQSNPRGHYECRAAPQFGPRTPTGAPHRVWVADAPRAATCDYGMKRSQAADCMSPTKGKSERLSAG
jgi:hypothetical protein